MNNPGSILKLWAKTVKTHETGKDPKSLPKKGQDQKTKVKQGLTSLKVKGATDLTTPVNAEKFLALRDKVGKLMTRYCRYLKAAKDEDKKLLPKYLKTVTRLTAVVLKLDPTNLSQDEEDPNLDSLEGVDVAAVENSMAAPDTDTDDDIDLDEAPSATPEKTTVAPAKNPEPALAAWQAAREGAIGHLRALAGHVAATGHPDTNKSLLEINAVIKNLTPRPATPQQVKELQDYLAKDDVVADVSELAFDLREPLLHILAEIKAQLPE